MVDETLKADLARRLTEAAADFGVKDMSPFLAKQVANRVLGEWADEQFSSAHEQIEQLQDELSAAHDQIESLKAMYHAAKNAMFTTVYGGGPGKASGGHVVTVSGGGGGGSAKAAGASHVVVGAGGGVTGPPGAVSPPGPKGPTLKPNLSYAEAFETVAQAFSKAVEDHELTNEFATTENALPFTKQNTLEGIKAVLSGKPLLGVTKKNSSLEVTKDFEGTQATLTTDALLAKTSVSLYTPNLAKATDPDSYVAHVTNKIHADLNAKLEAEGLVALTAPLLTAKKDTVDFNVEITAHVWAGYPAVMDPHTKTFW